MKHSLLMEKIQLYPMLKRKAHNKFLNYAFPILGFIPISVCALINYVHYFLSIIPIAIACFLIKKKTDIYEYDTKEELLTQQAINTILENKEEAQKLQLSYECMMFSQNQFEVSMLNIQNAKSLIEALVPLIPLYQQMNLANFNIDELKQLKESLIEKKLKEAKHNQDILHAKSNNKDEIFNTTKTLTASL